MTAIKRPINSHKAYHAHVYFEQQTLAFASALCIEAGERFGVRIGAVHQALVGPHPKWSCQITFTEKHFEQLVMWLDENRKELTVFIHPITGDDLADHSVYATWLGDSVELNLSMFGAQ